MTGFLLTAHFLLKLRLYINRKKNLDLSLRNTRTNENTLKTWDTH